MIRLISRRSRHPGMAPTVAVLALISALGLQPGPAGAQVSSFTQAMAEAAATDDALATWYRARGYDTVWTGADDAARRTALLSVLSAAADHGLPVSRYDPNALVAAFHAAETEGDRGRLEVRMSRAFLDYARDVRTGILTPSEVDRGILRSARPRSVDELMTGLLAGDPAAFLRGLPPKAPEYAQLMKEAMGLRHLMAKGGWGAPVPARSLAPGDSGPAVVALRDRLIAMGYLDRSVTESYDRAIQSAVQQFQLDHGQIGDGVAGEGTIIEINVPPEERLESIVVAMERLRWMDDAPRGKRHVWVNLPDFTAKIIDDGKVTFSTRAVIGKHAAGQHTPEFSDEMEFMVVNPSWSVPRSITVKEYLPLLQRNPNAVSHLKVIDSRGRTVSRGAVNFAAYTARNFPFALRQPPSDGNALGKVKFMFPNENNIYLHDTPSKSLFDHEVRAYSHGCIRLGSPFDFAYTLLARQTDDPQGVFARHLNTGQETTVPLDAHVPVHLVYFTAWPGAKGGVTYRRDIYERDELIFEALRDAGVVQQGVQG